jgi:hypothetical protein
MQYLKVEKLKSFMSNPNVSGPLILLVILYASSVSPQLPKNVIEIFKNKYFKFVSLTLILLALKVDPMLAVALILAFLMSVNVANNQPIWEFLDNAESGAGLENPGLISSPTSEISADAAVTMLDTSLTTPSPVNGMLQLDVTSTIQPTVQETSSGPMVYNPTVVIAPLAVTKPDGEVVIVTPEVTYVNTQEQELTPIQELIPITTPAPAIEYVPMKTNPDLEIKKPEDKCQSLDFYFKRSTDMTKVKPMNLGALADYTAFSRM